MVTCFSSPVLIAPPPYTMVMLSGFHAHVVIETAPACGNIRPMPTLGVYRHLTQCSGADGTFCVLAIDHRDNLIAELQKHRTSQVSYEDVVAFKTSVARLSACATAVLIDPDYGARSLICGAIPGAVGALAPLEVTDYRPHPSQL